MESSSVNDPAVISETLLVPKTNVFPDRDFAILDRMLQFWLNIKARFTKLQECYAGSGYAQQPQTKRWDRLDFYLV